LVATFFSRICWKEIPLATSATQKKFWPYTSIYVNSMFSYVQSSSLYIETTKTMNFEELSSNSTAVTDSERASMPPSESNKEDPRSKDWFVDDTEGKEAINDHPNNRTRSDGSKPLSDERKSQLYDFRPAAIWECRAPNKKNYNFDYFFGMPGEMTKIKVASALYFLKGSYKCCIQWGINGINLYRFQIATMSLMLQRMQKESFLWKEAWSCLKIRIRIKMANLRREKRS
jgi:hypothetical protein